MAVKMAWMAVAFIFAVIVVGVAVGWADLTWMDENGNGCNEVR